jgi:hypothetical protein
VVTCNGDVDTLGQATPQRPAATFSPITGAGGGERLVARVEAAVEAAAVEAVVRPAKRAAGEAEGVLPTTPDTEVTNL